MKWEKIDEDETLISVKYNLIICMFLKEFFYFQKSDRIVMVTALCVVIICIVVFFVIGGRNERTTLSADDSLNIQKSPISSNYSTARHQYYQVNGRTAELFPFDPNTADSTQLLRLGLSPWQVRNIYKYRAKGGIYRKASDFARLYGLTVKQYQAMEPYIHISNDYQPASAIYGSERETYARDTLKYPVKIKPTEHILLNTADTNMLKKVPGIGSGYARAIVNYRERLGGYYSVEQLKEIDGFPEEALTFFKLENVSLHKMNINKLTLNQLRKHPYCSFFQAREIMDYRRLKGPIKDLHQLGLLKDFSVDKINRLLPYIEY
jgi:competence ComEA-like helix-hairpin-helix protein